MKKHVVISGELHFKLKYLAVKEGTTVSQIIDQAVKDYLLSIQKKNDAEKGGRHE